MDKDELIFKLCRQSSSAWAFSNSTPFIVMLIESAATDVKLALNRAISPTDPRRRCLPSANQKQK